MKILTPLEKHIQSLPTGDLSDQRKQMLAPLINYLQSKIDRKDPIRLHFICTHNSRRSHMSQVWAQALAYYFQIPDVVCYSGGTESTAVHPMVTEVLSEIGFQVTSISRGDNPVYCFKFAENEHPVIGFSKTIGHDFNPVSGFGAVMTCSEANACPFVPGAEERFPIVYDDPRTYDDNPLQKEKYRERCLQIGTELAYVYLSLNK